VLSFALIKEEEESVVIRQSRAFVALVEVMEKHFILCSKLDKHALLVVRPLHNFLQSLHRRLLPPQVSCLGSTKNLNYAD
jgi:hypothetical protein